LGTILGIMETFTALSEGGVSDPGAVSRGIGTALTATAIGIATALYGLVGHNLLHRQAEHISEGFNGFLLRTTLYDSGRSTEVSSPVPIPVLPAGRGR
jgi:biopolymer transport protein ExbB